MRWLLAAIICFGLAIHVPPAGGGDKTAPKIEGRWQVTTITHPVGKKAPEDEAAATVFIFKDAKYKLIFNGNVLTSGTFKTDSSKQPTAIDLLDDGGNTYLGILKIEGDILSLAEKLGRQQRPKAFESRLGITLWVMKRTK